VGSDYDKKTILTLLTNCNIQTLKIRKKNGVNGRFFPIKHQIFIHGCDLSHETYFVCYNSLILPMEKVQAWSQSELVAFEFTRSELFAKGREQAKSVLGFGAVIWFKSLP